ncbi:unnamed protein product, partial [Prorocentrum cordatum]
PHEQDLKFPAAVNLDNCIATAKNIFTDMKVDLQPSMKEIHCARCCTAYNTKVERLEFNSSAGTDSDYLWRKISVSLLEREKAHQLEGMAPPRDFERKIHTAIDE